MIERDNNPKTFRDYVRLFFTGGAMGAADIVPGVSGGTMAFILGVYEDLLNAIKSVDLQVIKLGLQLKIREVMEIVPWRFLLALGTGILLTILTLARVLSSIMDSDPEYLFSFFFGLVLASIIAIGAKIDQWQPVIIGSMVAGAAIAVLIVTRTPSRIEPTTLNLFFSGMIAIMAMILPGISGSFILLIMGQYDNVLDAVSNFEIVSILAVGFGAILGLMLFSRVLSWLLNRYHMPVIALLVGFMIGSLWKIWPWKETLETDIDRHGHEYAVREANRLPEFITSEFAFAFLLFLIGFLLVTYIDHQQSRTNPVMVLFRRRNRQPVQ
ncbi:MAG: DUF368 domain-containing protein [Chloroflexi bacterium]|nr:DUF368 domain-containing protein [Chloroflexota bacterium]